MPGGGTQIILLAYTLSTIFSIRPFVLWGALHLIFTF